MLDDAAPPCPSGSPSLLRPDPGLGRPWGSAEGSGARRLSRMEAARDTGWLPGGPGGAALSGSTLCRADPTGVMALAAGLGPSEGSALWRADPGGAALCRADPGGGSRLARVEERPGPAAPSAAACRDLADAWDRAMEAARSMEALSGAAEGPWEGAREGGRTMEPCRCGGCSGCSPEGARL